MSNLVFAIEKSTTHALAIASKLWQEELQKRAALRHIEEFHEKCKRYRVSNYTAQKDIAELRAAAGLPVGNTAPKPTSEMMPDEFEAKLIDIFDLNEANLVKGRVHLGDETYAYTMTRAHLGFHEPVYFRAGDIFVMNPTAIDWASVTGNKEAMEEALSQYSKIIQLKEYPSEDGRGGWTLYSNDAMFGGRSQCYLPNVIGILIAMQNMKDQIKGNPFVDLGSRNGLLANAALMLGASEAILIDNDIPTPRISRSSFERYHLSASDNLIDINLKINGTQDRATICTDNFSEIPNLKLKNAVLAYNFPDFGYEYYNAKESELYELQKLAELGTSVKDEFKQFEKTKRESLIRDIMDKFRNLKWIIASGGIEEHETALSGSYKKRLIDEAKSLSLELNATVRIPQHVEGYHLENTPDATVIMPTMVFKTPESEHIHAITFDDQVKLLNADEQKLLDFIAISTDSMKGYEEETEQYQALNPLISSLRTYCDKKGIKFACEDSETLRSRVLGWKENNNARGVVLDLKDSIDELIPMLEKLNIDFETVLFADVNNKNMEENSDIHLMEMLSLTLELFRKGELSEKTIKEAEERLGFKQTGPGRISFEPDAEPINHDGIKLQTEELGKAA
jgi:hypothetical protein